MTAQRLLTTINFICVLICPLEISGLRLRVEEVQTESFDTDKPKKHKSIPDPAPKLENLVDEQKSLKLQINNTAHKIWNVALALPPKNHDEGILIGRWLRGPNHAKQCKTKVTAAMSKVTEGSFSNSKLFWMAQYSGKNNETLGSDLKFTPLALPSNIDCKHIGEPKPVFLNGVLYVQGDSGQCQSSMWKHLQGGWKQTYAKSNYKNFLIRMDYDAHGSLIPSKQAILLATEEPVNPKDKTQKNFRLFTYDNETFAITTVQDYHRVYKVDLSTGLMTPAYTTKGLKAVEQGHTLYMSTNPVDLYDGTFLVGAHASHGKWGGYRQSFFYRMKAKPPFNIIERTPEFSFGFNEKLEYMTGLNDAGKYFLLSVGVKDCDSSVFQIGKDTILSKLRAPRDSIDAPL